MSSGHQSKQRPRRSSSRHHDERRHGKRPRSRSIEAVSGESRSYHPSESDTDGEMSLYRMQEQARRAEARRLETERRELEATIHKLKAEARTKRREMEKQEELDKQRRRNGELQRERDRLLQQQKRNEGQTGNRNQRSNAPRMDPPTESAEPGQPRVGKPMASPAPEVPTARTTQEDDPDYGLGPTGGPCLSEGEESCKEIEINQHEPKPEPLEETPDPKKLIAPMEDTKDGLEKGPENNSNENSESPETETEDGIPPIPANYRSWVLLTGRLTGEEVQYILNRFPQLDVSNLFLSAREEAILRIRAGR